MICVDASVAAMWLLEEDFTAQADALYQSTIDANEVIVAPIFMVMEVNNALLKRIRKQELDPNGAEKLLNELRGLPITLLDPEPLHWPALSLATTYRLPAVYDAYYLTLAANAECPFWTADTRLVNTLNGRLPFVRWIGHYQG